MRTKQDELIESVTFCSNKVSDFEESLKDMKTTLKIIEEVNRENEYLKKEVLTLSERMDDLEQHSRNNNIEIQGVSEKKGLKENSEFVHRIQPEEDSGRIKNIIVGLSSKLIRDEVLASSRNKRKNQANDKPGLNIEALSSTAFLN
ncbi:hypothetical protein JTB14_012259 [Gonioctena quinquepunctata]|nr:hypothetical protein JTB14_012259 [Gonioctena quinquepunctata]